MAPLDDPAAGTRVDRLDRVADAATGNRGCPGNGNVAAGLLSLPYAGLLQLFLPLPISLAPGSGRLGRRHSSGDIGSVGTRKTRRLFRARAPLGAWWIVE